jgi:transcriptional regulator with XRE-family HTH domain
MATYHCRLRKYRKSAHVSQRELALLAGLQSQGAVSDIEAGRKRPNIETAFACATAFGVSVAELFPGLEGQARTVVLARARRLHTQLAGKPRRPTATAQIAALISRLSGA